LDLMFQVDWYVFCYFLSFTSNFKIL